MGIPAIPQTPDAGHGKTNRYPPSINGWLAKTDAGTIDYGSDF